MKKTFLFAILALCFSTIANAQFSTTIAKTSAGVDTVVVTNAGTGVMVLKQVSPHSVCNFTARVTKTSGTIVGTIKARGRNSLTGTSFDIPSASVTLADATAGVDTYYSYQINNLISYKYVDFYASGGTTVVYRAAITFNCADVGK